MNEAEVLAIANLLSILIPLGTKVYTDIQAAHADQLKPLDDILTATDGNWQTVATLAQAELAKLNPAT